mgnify:CR=1 FL=1
MSIAVKLNVSNLDADQESATNITLPCFLDSEVQIRLCTIRCGRWSSAALINSYNSTSPQIIKVEGMFNTKTKVMIKNKRPISIYLNSAWVQCRRRIKQKKSQQALREE